MSVTLQKTKHLSIRNASYIYLMLYSLTVLKKRFTIKTWTVACELMTPGAIHIRYYNSVRHFYQAIPKDLNITCFRRGSLLSQALLDLKNTDFPRLIIYNIYD